MLHIEYNVHDEKINEAKRLYLHSTSSSPRPPLILNMPLDPD
jgi:hypothetical protein